MEQGAYQHRNSPRPANGGTWSRDGVFDGIFAAAAIVALFALTLWIAPSLARALEIAPNVAVARSLDGESPFPRDLDEDQPEPPLAAAPGTGYPRSA